MNVFIQVSGVVEVSRCGTRSGLDIKPLWNMDVSCEHLHIDEARIKPSVQWSPAGARPTTRYSEVIRTSDVCARVRGGRQTVKRDELNLHHRSAPLSRFREGRGERSRKTDKPNLFRGKNPR